jgi:signal peptidase I
MIDKETLKMEDNNGNAPQKEQLNEEAERQISEIEEKVAKKKSGFWKEVKEWVVALVVALLVVFVIQTFLFRIIRVDGHSMDTTLADGERLFVTVTDVKFGSVQRDSVVICHYPNRYNKFLGLIPMQTYFVKRVVAIPGDMVYRKNEVTHVVYEKDGQTVDEMLDERYGDYFPNGSPDDYEACVLGEDEYFVVGDNRYNSHDSRDWGGPNASDSVGNDGNDENNVGPISKGMIVGRVRQVIWPLGSWRSVK